MKQPKEQPKQRLRKQPRMRRVQAATAAPLPDLSTPEARSARKTAAKNWRKSAKTTTAKAWKPAKNKTWKRTTAKKSTRKSARNTAKKSFFSFSRSTAKKSFRRAA